MDLAPSVWMATSAIAAERFRAVAGARPRRGSSLLRNVLHGLADDIVIGRAGCQVAERNHTDQALVLVQHRQPPDLALSHQVRSLSGLGVLKDIDQLVRHGVAHLGTLGIAALG